MRRGDRQVTDRATIQAILDRADACRIAFAVEDVPYIVCMNYGYAWEDELPVFYFHCAHEGRKIDLLKKNNRVCFQLDTDHALKYVPEKVYCTMDYASVVGMGRLEIVGDEKERVHGLNLLMEHHGHTAPAEYPAGSLSRTTMLRLRVTELTAKMK